MKLGLELTKAFDHLSKMVEIMTIFFWLSVMFEST